MARMLGKASREHRRLVRRQRTAAQMAADAGEDDIAAHRTPLLCLSLALGFGITRKEGLALGRRQIPPAGPAAGEGKAGKSPALAAEPAERCRGGTGGPAIERRPARHIRPKPEPGPHRS